MATLLVGFDSAWTETNSGALAGIVHLDDGSLCELGPPQIADFSTATAFILAWQAQHKPRTTIILLDQPTIVSNATGQRQVEHLVSSPVSRRYGGVQPANTGRSTMFGAGAPLWPFLRSFGGSTDPLSFSASVGVIETYPVLAIIALGWLIPDVRPTGRLPKYNPDRPKTFDITDWQFLCNKTATELQKRGLGTLAGWASAAAANPSPRKCDQDCVDACLCLLVALHFYEGSECLIVGDVGSGYIIVPHSAGLQAELVVRCAKTKRPATKWLRVIRRK